MAKSVNKAAPVHTGAGLPYEIVGLQAADSMPISFAGRPFDLASLSEEDAEFLLAHPDQVPYLRRKTDSQSND